MKNKISRADYDQADRDVLAREVFKGQQFRELGPRKGRKARLYLALSRGF
jgi:hypothetical protein